MNLIELAKAERKRNLENEEALTSVFSGMEFISENMRISLVSLSYRFFPEWEFIPDHDYNRGQVVRMGWNKFLFPDGGRINPGETPATSNRCKLFRDSSGFDPDGAKRHWIREEFCLLGFPRWWERNPGRPEQYGWYRANQRIVDGATEPPNDTHNWEFMGGDYQPPL